MIASRNMRLSALSGVLAGVLATCVVAGSSVAAPAPTPGPRAPHPSVAAATRALQLGVVPVAVDAAGVPRMLRAAHVAMVPGARATESAIGHVTALAGAWGVTAAAMPALAPLGEVAVPGGTITRLRQVIGGVPIHGNELRVLTRADGSLLAITGTLVGTTAMRRAPAFRGDELDAASRALAAIHHVAVDATRLASTDGLLFSGSDGAVDVDYARVTREWFRDRDGSLVAAWIIDSRSTGPVQRTAIAQRTVIAATSGRILARYDLTKREAVSYRVWADADGRPKDGPAIDWSPRPTDTFDATGPDSYTAPSLVTIPGGLNHPAGSANPDPWLADGATTLLGNNVTSYADLYSPDGFATGDIRPTATGPHAYDRIYDTSGEAIGTTDQTMAATTMLFFLTNYLHDFWYDAGFTEAAGNAQQDNYGRGGIANDRLRAEAQDDAYNPQARDNANMSTPADGAPPTMQVYLSTGTEHLHTAIATPGGSLASGLAAFGPRNFDVTASVVDLGAGCTAPGAAIAGAIALVTQNAACSAEAQVQLAQTAGAVGVLYVKTTAAAGTLAKDKALVNTLIPSFAIGSAEGATVRANLGAGAVSVRLVRTADVETDADLDNTTAGHEYGHYVHQRLAVCQSNTECGGMGEGWGDFMALLLVARGGDNLDGIYPYGAWPPYAGIDNLGYFGIRRFPYSVNPLKNPLMFHHMSNGQSLPAGIPNSYDDGQGAEVHAAGEVWGNTLWNVYVALQKAHGPAAFEETRKTMAKYVVGSMMMTPDEALTLEARDAMLAVAEAASPADATLMAQVFASRGMGSCAVDAERGSSDLVGIVDSTGLGGNLVAASPALAITDSCDADQSLDVGESATLTVPFMNAGRVAMTNLSFALAAPPAGLVVTHAPDAIATLAAGASVDVVFTVKLTAAEPASSGSLTVKALTPDGCAAEVLVPYEVTLESDTQLASSATDAFDAPSVWVAAGADTAWAQELETGSNSLWHATDVGDISDHALVSPEVTVSATAALVVTLEHRYSFDHEGGNLYDGGVIELSQDHGATWVDASTLATVPYDGMLSNRFSNPIGGQRAFAGVSIGYPAMTTLTLDFGMALAGKAIQLRFRQGTDDSAGDDGWFVDNVAFAGITTTPFPAIVADATTCATDGGDGADGGDGGGCCQSGGTGAGGASALAAFGLVALTRRRRRR